MKYALDLHSVGRHVVTQVSDGGEQPPSVPELAASYRPGNPSDLTRVMGFEGIETPELAKEWMVRQALDKLTRYIEVNGNDVPRWREGHSLETARWDRKKLEPRRETKWASLFDPTRVSYMTPRKVGTDAAGAELKESMRQFGWIKQFPALQDEFGFVLSGNRRLACAAELREEGVEVEDRIDTIVLGRGTEANARRLAIYITANLGSKPPTPKERAKLSQHLYGDAEWDVPRIAEALQVDERTVLRDIADIPKRRGRITDPEWQEIHDPIIRLWMDGQLTRAEAVRKGKQTEMDPCSDGTYKARRSHLEGEESVAASDTMSETAQTEQINQTDSPDPAPPVSEVCPTCGRPL